MADISAEEAERRKKQISGVFGGLQKAEKTPAPASPLQDALKKRSESSSDPYKSFSDYTKKQKE